MPLYEYECQSCHRRLEKIQKFSDPPLDVCPHCGGRLEKLISSPAFQFKGSGWYVTDYARKSGESDKSDKVDKSDKAESADKSGSAEASGKSDKDTPAKTPAAETTSTSTKDPKGSKDTPKSSS